MTYYSYGPSLISSKCPECGIRWSLESERMLELVTARRTAFCPQGHESRLPTPESVEALIKGEVNQALG